MDGGQQIDLGKRKTMDQNLACYSGFNLISLLAKNAS